LHSSLNAYYQILEKLEFDTVNYNITERKRREMLKNRKLFWELFYLEV